MIPFVLIAVVVATTGPGSVPDGQAIEQLTGAKGKLDAAEGVFKVSVPRSDLSVSVSGIRVVPAMGLTSWAAFKRAGDKSMVMGDIVLEAGQVDPVMLEALDNGLDVTALHNHFLDESPRVMFMHVGGMGEESQLGRAVGAVFRKLKATQGAPSGASPVDTSLGTIDPRKLDEAFGSKGDFKNGIYKITLGRRVEMGNHEVGSAMGVNTWAAVAGGPDRAVIDGDFAVLESELQPVLKALRHAGISVVAIHQHMTAESPRMMFLHYWGIGSATSLARGIAGAAALTGSGH